MSKRENTVNFIMKWYRNSEVPFIPIVEDDWDISWEDAEQFYCDSIGLGINANEVMTLFFLSELRQ